MWRRNWYHECHIFGHITNFLEYHEFQMMPVERDVKLTKTYLTVSCCSFLFEWFLSTSIILNAWNVKFDCISKKNVSLNIVKFLIIELPSPVARYFRVNSFFIGISFSCDIVEVFFFLNLFASQNFCLNFVNSHDFSVIICRSHFAWFTW